MVEGEEEDFFDCKLNWRFLAFLFLSISQKANIQNLRCSFNDVAFNDQSDPNGIGLAEENGKNRWNHTQNESFSINSQFCQQNKQKGSSVGVKEEVEEE